MLRPRRAATRSRVCPRRVCPGRRCTVEACQHVRAGSKLAADRSRIIATRGRNIGIVAAARRLLTLVFYGLRDGEIRALAAGAA